MSANKAVLAAVLAGLTALLASLQGAPDSLSFRDWLIIVLSAVVAGLGVYIVPNRPWRRQP